MMAMLYAPDADEVRLATANSMRTPHECRRLMVISAIDVAKMAAWQEDQFDGMARYYFYMMHTLRRNWHAFSARPRLNENFMRLLAKMPKRRATL